jgi:hypothetical protein
MCFLRAIQLVGMSMLASDIVRQGDIRFMSMNHTSRMVCIWNIYYLYICAFVHKIRYHVLESNRISIEKVSNVLYYYYNHGTYCSYTCIMYYSSIIQKNLSLSLNRYSYAKNTFINVTFRTVSFAYILYGHSARLRYIENYFP